MRYTVERCKKQGGYPRHYGYTLRDAKPHIQTTDDIEGVGLCNIGRIVHTFVGWYKHKADAVKACNERNNW